MRFLTWFQTDLGNLGVQMMHSASLINRLLLYIKNVALILLSSISDFRCSKPNEFFSDRMSYVQSGAAYHSLGFEDENLGSSPGWWAATVATYCRSRPGNYPNSYLQNLANDRPPHAVRFPHFYGEILQLLPRREVDDVLINARASLK